MYFGYGMMHSRKETKGMDVTTAKAATPIENGGIHSDHQNGGKPLMMQQQNGHLGYDSTITANGYDNYGTTTASPFQPQSETPLPPGPFQRAKVDGQAYSYDINY